MPIAPRVNIAPLPGARLTANVPDAAFGGGAGDAIAGIQPGLSAIHDEAYQIARQEKAKADSIMLTAATADLSSARTDTLYGPNGALTKQGKDAFDAPETARSNYFQRAGQIRAGLTSDEQREAFDHAMAADWSSVDEQVQRHVATQRQAYDTRTTDALVANKQDEAFKGYTDPTVVQSSIDTQKAAITAYGQRNGWSDDETTRAVANQVSATHAGVITRMLDTDQDQAATSYYTAHKAEISGSEQEKLERAIGIGSTQGDALRRVNTILQPKADGTPVTAEDALAETEKIERPQVREEALKLVTAHFNELNTAQRIDRENARARVMQNLESNNGRLNQASADWQTIDGYPEGEQVLERQRQILHPPPDRGDPEKYASFLALAATNQDTRAQLLGTDVGAIATDPTMNGPQKAAIINLIRNERAKDVTELRRTHTEAEATVKSAQRDVKAATDADDDNLLQAAQSRLYVAQQRETVLRGQLQTATRGQRPAATSSGTSKRAAPAAPAAPAPSDARTPTNPIGLEPIATKPLTPEMQHDLGVYGAGYANYLRTMGYEIPSATAPTTPARTATAPARRPAARPQRTAAPATSAPSSSSTRPAGGYPNPFRP